MHVQNKITNKSTENAINRRIKVALIFTANKVIKKKKFTLTSQIP